MSKFFGKVGYSISQETSPGYWTEEIVERDYFGDMIRNYSNPQSTSDGVNDNLRINNDFSILADPYAYNNFQSMKYVLYLGTKWKITSVEVQYPRLLIKVGGVFNG